MASIIPKAVKNHYRAYNMEHQFWGYELGNIVAVIGGAGGFKSFAEKLSGVFNDATLRAPEKITTVINQYPDAAAAIGIGAIVVGAPLLKKIFIKAGQRTLSAIDAVATVGATGTLAYVLSQDTSWITTSATSFVVGSSFLKYAQQNPFFLKAGGIALTAGGVALTAFGMEVGQAAYSDPNFLKNLSRIDATATIAHASLPALTFISGIYVTLAGALTYEGGIYETEAYREKEESNSEAQLKGWVATLTHPTKGQLAKAFTRTIDAPIKSLNALGKNTLLRALPRDMRDTQPFLTSMWARLPWRLLTGTAAVLTGNYAFAAANVGWGYGDMNIGILDMKPEDETEIGPVLEA